MGADAPVGSAEQGGECTYASDGLSVRGHHLEAENDEELFKEARKHADEVHPEQGFTDEQRRSLIAENVYDK
jgi:predicted small metal-binding protein